jgi:hypothetical protein
MNIYKTNKLELTRRLSHLCIVSWQGGGGVEFEKVI